MLSSWEEEDGIYTWNYPQPDLENAKPHCLELLQAGYPPYPEDNQLSTDEQFRNWEMENHFVVNRFELVEIGENRLQIDITCEYIRMLWFVLATLDFIAAAWSESKPEIDKNIAVLKKIDREHDLEMGFVNEGIPPESKKSVFQKPSIFRTTVNKINKVIALREADIATHKPIRGKVAICGEVPIDPKTLDKHFPELANKWDDYDYRPKRWGNSED